MYTPTENERKLCYCIVRELIKGRKINIDEAVDDVFATTYSIGGAYDERTLKSVAEVVISRITDKHE